MRIYCYANFLLFSDKILGGANFFITDFQDAGDLGRFQDLGGQFDQSPLISVQHSGKLKLFTFASFELFIRYKLSTIVI